MNIEDKRETEWKVVVNNQECPHLYYPANIIGCDLLPDGDNYCCEQNCPLKLSDALTRTAEAARQEEREHSENRFGELINHSCLSKKYGRVGKEIYQELIRRLVALRHLAPSSPSAPPQ